MIWFLVRILRSTETTRRAAFINKVRSAVSESSVRCWFSKTKELLEPDYGISNHPKQIFNMDETDIFLPPEAKNVYDVGTSNKRCNNFDCSKCSSSSSYCVLALFACLTMKREVFGKKTFLLRQFNFDTIFFLNYCILIPLCIRWTCLRLQHMCWIGLIIFEIHRGSNISFGVTNCCLVRADKLVI